MSAYHNQTNISPGTLFSGQGGSSNLAVNTIQGDIVLNNLIDMNNGGGGIRVQTGVSSFVMSYGGMTDTRAEILPVSGVQLGFFNSSGGVNPGGYWAFGNNSGVANQWGVGISSISSMAGNGSAATGTINMNALISTLKVAYPGCVS